MARCEFRHGYGALTLALLSACTGLGQPMPQDLFVAGEGGYHTYRIPSVILTTNQTLLAFCEGRKRSAGDSGDIDILLRRSSDGGRTWTRPQVVWDDEANTCGNPCPVVDQTTGVIWLFMTHNPGRALERQITQGAGGERTVWLAQSSDDGVHWSVPLDVTTATKRSAWNWYATGPGVGIQVRHGPHRGRLVIPCDHTVRAETNSSPNSAAIAESHVVYSDDHGKSWKMGGSAGPDMNECQVLELADPEGTLLLNMRNYGGETQRAISFSHDGGQTWSAPQRDPILIEPRCQASLLRYDWPRGTTPGRVLFANPASTRRVNLTIRVSFDEAKTWPCAQTLYPGPSAYSCMAVLPDNTIVCLFECGKRNPYEKIACAHFSLSWVEGRK